MRSSTYQDALDFLFARTTGGFKFGLERSFQLLEHLGNPERRYPTIHVAGTNGKGSSVATMRALLAARGLRVATYTSPHLVDFRERMIVGHEPIPADDVIAFIDTHLGFIEAIGASFFEATTAMAFDYFARAKADVAIIEAGLGGRLDSTNVIDPIAAGVTSIGFDHTEYLGSTLEEIAGEKAGIFKPGRVAVIGEREPRIRDLLVGRAHAAGASAVRVAPDEITFHRVEVTPHGTACDMSWRGERHTLTTPLAGQHQAANLAFSLVMLDSVGALSPDFSAFESPVAHRASPVDWLRVAGDLALVRIPGRFEQIGRMIFDVAHNPAGSQVLVDTLEAIHPEQPVTAVLCVLRDKDWRAMMTTLSKVASRFILTMAPTAPASRAWDLDEALAFAQAHGLTAQAVSDFDDALSLAQAREGTIVVTGSFHTVGDAMARLKLSPLEVPPLASLG